MIASGTPTSDNDGKDNHNNDSTSTQYSKMINNKNNNKK